MCIAEAWLIELVCIFGNVYYGHQTKGEYKAICTSYGIDIFLFLFSFAIIWRFAKENKNMKKC